MLTLTEITTLEEFAALESEWKRLGKNNHYPPFLSYDWFCACIEAYGAQKSLATVALWDEGRLIAVAPLWIHTTIHRRLRARILTFITCPDTVFSDFIIDQDYHEDAISSIYRHIAGISHKWDILQLGKWLSDSPNQSLFSAYSAPRNSRSTVQVDSKIPYVDIRQGWECFLKSRSVKFRKTRRNIENRIARIGNTRVTLYSSGTPSELLENILKVSQKGWKASQGISLASQNEHIAFFEKLIGKSTQNGWLYLWLLSIEDKPAAMEFDLLSDGCAYALRADFDPDFKDISPGTYLETQILKHLSDHQQQEYCTGPGLNDYKKHLTETHRTTNAVTLFNSNLKGLVLWNLEGRIIPKLRSFRQLVQDCLQKSERWRRKESAIEEPGSLST